MCETQHTRGLLLKMLNYFEVMLNYSHKKRRDRLETRAVLLIFLVEFDFFGVAVHEIYRNSIIK